MKKILIFFLLISISTFSHVSADTDGENPISKKNQPVKDCFEGLNRGIFAFNKGLDNVVFEPLAKGYRKLPMPLKLGASNVVSNLSNLITVPNNFLQGDVGVAGNNTMRFAINSTVGILGLWDPASRLGFEKENKEDYGQTLGKWGVGEGCYVVLPVLGPSTARDAVGSIASFMGGDPWYNVTIKNDTQHFTDFDYYASRATSGIDFRAKNIDSFDNLEKNSMDFYASVKSLYLQDRQKKISNSKKATNTLDDGDWEEIETN
jgi:phospholipid-binding lipoprotein MlaA